jgi:anaerobic selenocysteine-containing dehydrogenase
VFQILQRLSAGQPCNITGIEDYESLRMRGGIQWPFPINGDERQERRLFEDGKFYHPDGRAKFLFESEKPFAEQPNNKFPFILLTGRGTASQWHTQTRTKKSAVLCKLSALELYVEINPQDATKLGIRTGEAVEVSSQRGRLQGRAVVTPAVQPGHVFIPMHYEATNLLTHPQFDPYSHQPAYKACAVAVVAL